VIDFSDIENSWNLPTGQSGNPLSPHYNDQRNIQRRNFRKMMLNKEEIVKTSTKLVLSLVKTKGFKALK
jgi:penicillin amidase